jgi:mono/diheme cytochrome c family protein
MLEGWKLFGTRGCGTCHSVRGFGGKDAPDLASARGGTSFFEIGAALWNHLPQMGARMRVAGVERSRLTPGEAGNLVAFLFTARYLDPVGDVGAGKVLFTSKGCVQCHAVGGSGGSRGPALDRLARTSSPVLVAAAMWNHAPAMAEAMRAQGIARPTFQGRELVDLIAYIVASASDGTGDTAQVVPGTPEHGEQLFAEKKCVTCHAVAGRGGRIGPDLGRPGHHMSLTEFAGRMWNHSATMATRMKERGLDVPTLSGQDVADLLAYLFVSRYFESAGQAQRGRQVMADKGCLGCHAVSGKGGSGGGDFARSTVVGSPSALVAAMWNHASLMETEAARRNVAWPTLTGTDLRDIASYLGEVSRGAPPPRPR